MKYRSSITNVEFFAFHGLYPEEKILGGKYIVDISVELEAEDDASMKRFSEIVNYEKLYSIAKKQMGIPRELVETVAKFILDDIQSKFPKIIFTEVTITKLQPGGVFKSGHSQVSLSRKVE
ncbi:MAG: dihydroneopterin aldolase [Bacteroidia bacterium]